VNDQFPEIETGIWEPVPGTAADPEPLLSASRKVRIEALSLMSEIVTELKREAQCSLETIRAAKEMAANL
jgi:hypothetical protein